MIPANGEYFAHYGRENGKPAPAREVIAWSSNGEALVLGRTGLRPADQLSGFEGVHHHADRSKVVAAIPGGGWLIDWKNDEDDEWTTSPILFWAVQADGTAAPVEVDTYGETGSALAADRCYVYHPDHDQPAYRKAAGVPMVVPRQVVEAPVAAPGVPDQTS